MLVALLLAGSFAATARAERPAPDRRAEAKARYEAGLRAYNVGDFDVAIREWRAGYKLIGSPDFLFNIAQAYRQKGDYGRAIFFVDAFLREKPEAPNRAEITALREDMERLLKQQQSNKEKPPQAPIHVEAGGSASRPAANEMPPARVAMTSATETGPETPGALPPTPPEDQGLSGRRLRLAGWTTGGAGLVLLATGIGLAAAASSTEGSLEDAAARGDPWTGALADDERSARRQATTGVVLAALGAGAIVGGTVLYYLGWRRDRARAELQVSAAPLPGRGLQLAAHVRF